MPTVDGRRERRFGRVSMVVVLAMAVAVLTADLYVLSQRNVTTVVDLDDALADFRAAPSLADEVDATTTTTVATTVPPSTDASRAPTVSAASEPIVERPRSSSAPAPTVAGPRAYRRPPQGVYTYVTTGGESISVAGSSHDYPDRTYATIRHGDGCGWEYRNEVVKEHVDTLRLCSEPGRLTQTLQRRDVTFFGQNEGASATCAPPLVLHADGLADDARMTTTCQSSDGGSFAMTRTFKGEARHTIGGRTIDVVVVTLHGDMTGKKRGTSDDTLWLAADTGLVVRWERSVDTVADTDFGASVHYVEHATFELESLTPTT